MSDHKSHQSQTHTHGTGCDHATIAHGDHKDYVQGGHRDHIADGKAHPHQFEVNEMNPAACTPKHACGAHAADHVHGAGCAHEAVPHGDHTDYVVNGHLHHPCDKHCDNHGPVSMSKTS